MENVPPKRGLPERVCAWFGSGRWRAYLLAVVTGMLMVLSFPSPDLDFLIWVTLVPLFVAARGVGGKRGFRLGYVAGLVLEAGGFSWILHAISAYSGLHGAWFPVALALFLGWLVYEALLWGFFGALLGRCSTPAAMLLVVPVWVGLEAAFPRLFPWHLGGAVYKREWLRQGADLFGASGLSFVILFVNVTIALALEWRRGRCPFPRRELGVSLVLIIGLNVYGAFRLSGLERDLESVEPIRVGVIQPSLDPVEKNGLAVFLKLLAETERWDTDELPDLVLWPEGYDPFGFLVWDGADPMARHRTSDTPEGTVFDPLNVPLFIGGFSVVDKGPPTRAYNSAAYVVPKAVSGTDSQVSFYHKNKLLLFGERLPFQSSLPSWLLSRINVRTLPAGTECPIFTLRSRAGAAHRFRGLVCYEAILPSYAREKATDNTDFFANITEDFWYGQTSHVGQHVSVLMMRAVETRTPLVRCANAGPSGVIEATGAFHQRTRPFKSEKKSCLLQPRAFPSVFKSGGYLFPWAALGVAIAWWWALRSVARRRA